MWYSTIQDSISCSVLFCSNFQIRLSGSSQGNTFQHQEECTVTAALNCRIQKQQEVISKLSFVIIL